MRAKFSFNLFLSLIFILIFLFSYSWASLKVNPEEIMNYLLASLGSNVGVSVSVPKNPYNTLASQLEEWSLQLQGKEKMLSQKEIELNQKRIIKGNIILDLILAVLVIIFILILLNFYFDYKYRQKQRRTSQGV